FVVVIIFERLASDSIINLVFKVAGYTYGPILGMFVFGLISKRGIRERWMPVIALLSPIMSYILQWIVAEKFGYQIGFELLGYNALFTIFGLSLISTEKHDYNE
ncbi:MAG: sodium:solute symporter, partial [Alistipes sp.]|nr:sodium:solute symporter [Alistipes sp.]